MYCKKKIRTIMSLSLSFVALSLLVNCQAKHEGNSSTGIIETGNGNGADAPSGNGDIEVLANKRTASVVRSGRHLETLVSCLGTQTASTTAKQVWNDNKGSLSVEGDANSITSPMLVAMANITAEVCNDLINNERGIAAAQRRIFPQIDFGAGPNAVSGTALSDSIRRIARSCWGRNETAAELEMLQTSTSQAFSAANNNGTETANQMIYLCSAMASAFATFEM